jgi:hypothetical protein
MAAADVDLADNPPAEQTRFVAFLHDPGELVSRDSPVTVIACKDLQVRSADTRIPDPDPRPSFGTLRLGYIRPEMESIIKYKGLHAGSPIFRGLFFMLWQVNHPRPPVNCDPFLPGTGHPK